MWDNTVNVRQLNLNYQLFHCKVTAFPLFCIQIVCIWGAGGATPGKFLIGLRVVTCDSSVLVQPNRVLVLPATNVSLSAWVVNFKDFLLAVYPVCLSCLYCNHSPVSLYRSTVRALNKNFSIAFFFPAFITLLFFQHNRTVYDMVAGTIVVKRSRVRWCRSALKRVLHWCTAGTVQCFCKTRLQNSDIVLSRYRQNTQQH